MGMNGIRRMAADMLGVGESRVRFHTEHLAKIKEALTRNDVRERIREGVIYALPVRGRRKKERKRRSTSQRRGPATRNRKERWMEHVRSQRRYMRALLEKKELNPTFKRSIYMKIKSGIFRNKKALHAYLEENRMLLEGKK